MKKKGKIIAMIVILVLISILLIVLPPSLGRLPKIEGENSLSERTTLNVDGSDLSLMLISKDISNPVLIVCGGGPGIPQYLMEYMYPSALSEEFTVCYWDYRGTGASYSSDIDPQDMTTDRFIADTVAVTDYLASRFSQDKIFIMGHSFGTYVAINTVSLYPEKYCAYIAMSQITDQVRSETIAYEYMREQYSLQGDNKMVEKFDQYDITTPEGFASYRSSMVRDNGMHGLGIGTTRDMDNVITDIFFPSLHCTTYTMGERIDIWRGKKLSGEFPVHDDTADFNAFEDIPSLEIPVFFVVGRYDYTCYWGLQEEYYEAIEAPIKELYMFEESAHSPLYEEYDRGREVLIDIKDIVL